MLSRRLLLITLLSGMFLAGIQSQNNVHVHGTVTDPDGTLLDSVNILVSALYADSSGTFQSLYTVNGYYEVDFDGPPLNFLGIVEVSMVDCFGTLLSQNFPIFNGASDIEANFVYCEQIFIDSCLVYIVEEWNPGALPGLTAWTYANEPVDYQWSTGETTQTIYPNESGTYCVDVIFPWGCTGSDCYDFDIDSLGNCFSYISSVLNNDGTYYLEVYTTGLPPFTYLWNTGETTSSLSNVGPGTYCVTTTDANNCSNSTCVILDDFNFCEVWIYETPGFGGLTAEGFGQPPINYVWSTGDTTQTIFPDSAGVYCVTATDQNDCQSTSCYDYGSFFDSCFVYIVPIYLDSNTIGLQAIPGSDAQSIGFLWNTGETTDIIYPQDPSQTYCVTMTDSDGCTAESCFENNQFCYAWVDAQYIDTNTAVLTVYTDPIFGWGGSNTATYIWSNGETGPVITVGENGEYCVTATLGPNCVTEACVYVDFDNLQLDCAAWVYQYQDSSGQWFAEVYAWGFGTFTYLWSNGDTTPVTAISSPDEFQCVTATSSFGCVAEACVDTTFNPCQVYITIDYFNSGAVLNATSWYGGIINSGAYVWNNGLTGPIITVIEEGTYCVTFTSNDGCTSEACVDVIFWNIDSCGVWISTEPYPAGTLFTANAWGTSPFTYLWSNGWTEASQVIDFGPLDLCVTVTDATGCVSSACTMGIDTLDPNNGINVISGYVFADSVHQVKGLVYAYAMEANSGVAFALVDSALIEQNGFYSFNGLKAGVYILKAAFDPQAAGASEFIPTYHLSSATWEEANRHVIPNWLPVTTDIWMKSTEGGNGSGVIGGVISDPNHIIAGAGEEERGVIGLPNVVVLLKNEEGRPINYTYSDGVGSFSFTNLAFGTYRLSYDIPGLHSPDVWVTLTSEDPERLQVTLIVNQGTVSVNDPVLQELFLYPNPANEMINIIMPNDNLAANIQIVDMQGRVVYEGSGRSFNGIMTIKVDQFSPGLFQINLKNESQFYYSRFVKLE